MNQFSIHPNLHSIHVVSNSPPITTSPISHLSQCSIGRCSSKHRRTIFTRSLNQPQSAQPSSPPTLVPARRRKLPIPPSCSPCSNQPVPAIAAVDTSCPAISMCRSRPHQAPRRFEPSSRRPGSAASFPSPPHQHAAS
ncbi:hypothetical protein M0R45_008805 [Rubus argutus]|uniref:Uncharacterized protein n=1 Tax=Rubus argutus TaxID=59490 RepID=A0AAW1Y633_RUBAR